MGRIELDISDDRKFQDVALLIDRDEVLKFITSIKEKCDKKFKKISKPTALDEFLRYDIRPQINSFLAKLKYPPGFINPILAAIQNDRITNEDVRHCYMRFHGERIIDKSLPALDTPRDSILITLYPFLIKGRKKQLIKDISDILEILKQLFISLPPNHPLNLDIHTDIRNARDWYWKNKNKISSNEIREDYNRGKHEDDWLDEVNIIDQAISRYRELLSSDI